MKYQTTIVKSFFTVFILTFISSGLSAGTLGLDGKKKDKEKKEELSADGPYVIYEPDGKVCVISVTAQGQIEDTTYTVLPQEKDLPLTIFISSVIYLTVAKMCRRYFGCSINWRRRRQMQVVMFRFCWVTMNHL